MLERRTHERVPLAVPILCEPAHTTPFGGTAMDISPGGAGIVGSQVPPLGAALTVNVRLPGSPDVSRLRAVVHWARFKRFGVRFDLVGDRDARTLEELTTPNLDLPRTGAR